MEHTVAALNVRKAAQRRCHECDLIDVPAAMYQYWVPTATAGKKIWLCDGCYWARS